MTPDARESARSLLRSEAAEAVAVDRRVWATLRDLFRHPIRLTRAQMAGDRTHYLPPLRLFITLTSLCALVQSFAPRPERLTWRSAGGKTVSVTLATASPATSTEPPDARMVATNQQLARQGIPAAVADERRNTRAQTLAPFQVALGLLFALPVLWLMDRRRALSEHLVFLFATGNVIWAWCLVVMPLAFVSFWLNGIVAFVIAGVVLAVLFARTYGRSAAATGAGLLALLASQVLGTVVLIGLTKALIERSLLLF